MPAARGPGQTRPRGGARAPPPSPLPPLPSPPRPRGLLPRRPPDTPQGRGLSRAPPAASGWLRVTRGSRGRPRPLSAPSRGRGRGLYARRGRGAAPFPPPRPPAPPDCGAAVGGGAGLALAAAMLRMTVFVWPRLSAESPPGAAALSRCAGIRPARGQPGTAVLPQQYPPSPVSLPARRSRRPPSRVPLRPSLAPSWCRGIGSLSPSASKGQFVCLISSLEHYT